MKTLKDLTPDPKNRRTHTSRNVEMITEAIESVGTGRSIVIDEDDVVLAGNATVKAAGVAGLTKLKIVEAEGDEVIAVRRRGLSSEQKRALAIYDNRTAELAEWDVEQLVEDVDAGLDLGAFFEPVELDELLPPSDVEGLTDPDEIPVQRATDIKPGDLFTLGDHRLLCGDSTTAEDVARVVGGERVDICATDPPYGVGFNYKGHDDSDLDAYWSLMSGWMDQAKGVSDLVVCTVGYKHNTEWFLRFAPDTFCVWFDSMKQSPHKAAYLCKSELVLVFGKVPERWAWDTWQINSVRGDGLKELHPCPKPVELWVEILKPSAYRLVYDPFCGSGTTIIAAEQLGRKCYGIEIEPSYCQVTIDRWEAFTGKTATQC